MLSTMSGYRNHASFKRSGSWAPGAGVSKPLSKQRHQVSRHKSDLKSMNFRAGSLNVGTLKGRAGEVVETLQRRNIDICCVQEVRFSGRGVRLIEGKHGHYKLLWSNKITSDENEGTFGGVGVFVASKWVEKITEVVRVSDRIMYVKILVGECIVTFVSALCPAS